MIFSLLSKAVLKIKAEAGQASENKEELQHLAWRADCVLSMMPSIKAKLQAPGVMNALTELHQCLTNLIEVIADDDDLYWYTIL